MAHLPAADDNSLIGCTSHESTDDWSQPVPISFTAGTHFAARLGVFFYRTRCTILAFFTANKEKEHLFFGESH